MNSNNKYRCIKISNKCCASLRKISENEAANIIEYFPAVANIHCSRICETCRNTLRKARSRNESNVEQNEVSNYLPITPSDEISEELNELPTCTSRNANTESNELIENINDHIIPHLPNQMSPLKRKYIKRDAYRKRKSLQILENIADSLGADPLSDLSAQLENVKAIYEEILQNIKYQIENSSNLLEKQKLLSLLPINMSHAEIKDRFGDDISHDCIKKSKDIQRNKTKFADINLLKMSRRSLPTETLSTVKLFYEDDEISRMMPGSQDSITVKQGNLREKVQKRLMLSSLRESYYEFKKKHPLAKVGFTKFTMLRPKNCMKLGVGNQQNICVCTLHQNMKLMFEKSGLKSICIEGECTFTDYKDVLKFVVCNGDIQKSECCVSMCGHCFKNLNNLKTHMLKHFENNQTEEIIYKKWNTTIRCVLETLTTNPESFVSDFTEHIKVLIPHHFIAKRQSEFIGNKRAALLSGEMLIQMDFAENYAFLVQDAVQGYHWNNDQATIHPFVIYYKGNYFNILVLVNTSIHTHQNI